MRLHIWLHTVNSLQITLILQPVCNDVKVGPALAHENRLRDDESGGVEQAILRY